MTNGVVLEKIPAGEADAFYTVYTEDFGKIRCRASGVKKEGAKLAGHLEPLTISRITFVMGRQGERLTNAFMLHGWDRIRLDYEKLSAAWLMVRSVNEHCFPAERDVCVWKLLRESLLVLEEHEFGKEVADRFSENLKRCLGSA